MLLIDTPPGITAAACLAGLSLLTSTSARPDSQLHSTSHRLIPKRARSSSLIKRAGDEYVKPMFRLGLAEGKEVELVHRHLDTAGSIRQRDFEKRAEGDEVVGAIEDLETRSG